MGKKKSLEGFIQEAELIHGNKYDYSQVKYINTRTPIKIVCNLCHNSFSPTPKNHLSRKSGCPYCYGNARKTTKEFIEEANIIHNKKYDYTNVVYKNAKEPIHIICPKHGDFTQIPNDHLNGSGCPKCANEYTSNILRLTNESFIKKANKIHNGFYSYNKVSIGKNNKTEITITCPIHGDFLQTPNRHLKGCGCPICKSSHLEREIRQILQEKKINFIEQANRKHLQWLGLQSLDFYLPDYNVAIECQGRQHFEPVDIFGGEDEFSKRQILDELKFSKCQENKVKILYYTKENIENYHHNLIKNKEDLLKELIDNNGQERKGT